MAKIYLQRHTKPDVDPSICYGVSDVALSEEFDATHLPRVLERLQGVSVGRIYTSPLQRAHILAERIAQMLDVCDLRVDERLIELNFGDWELASWDDIYASSEGKKWFDDYINQPTLNGESFRQMVGRAKSFLEDVSADPQDIIVVTHSGFMHAAMVVAGAVSPQRAFDEKIEYGELRELQIDTK